MYKWEGLPDTIDERFLELTLFDNGYGLYFRDEIIGDLFYSVRLEENWMYTGYQLIVWRTV